MATKKRITLFDFWRSIFMLFVFFHHFYLTFVDEDLFFLINPFAELFVILAGFMVGFVFLQRDNNQYFYKRSLKILTAYYLTTIPITILINSFGIEKKPIFSTLINVLFMIEDGSWVSILRFYGIIFLLIPIIFKIYKFNRTLTVLLSLMIFIASTKYYWNYEFQSYFIKETLMTIIQWQLFFILGILFGELYKKKMFNKSFLLMFSLLIIIGGLLLHITIFNELLISKHPYSFGKLLNTFYIAPILLIIFYFIHTKIDGSKLESKIRTVGRNSLISFVMSEWVRFSLFCLVTFIPQLKQMSQLTSIIVSSVFAFVLLNMVFKYDQYKSRKKLSEVETAA